jgi:hypothetical protein
LTLALGEGISMNKSLDVHYSKLSTNQGFANAQFNHDAVLFSW